MSSPQLWVVLVDYNGVDDTLKCLQSLHAQIQECASRHVVVIDNASRVSSLPAVAEQFPWVHRLHSAKNGGWAGGNNLGIKYALSHQANLIVLLNNDTTVTPDFCTRLEQAAADHPDFGIFGPVIRFMEPPHEVQTEGVRFNPPNKPAFFDRIAVPLQRTEPSTLIEGDIVNGCCLLLRPDVVTQIGFIDERFFLIHEESDFCLRAQAAGWKNGVLAEALVFHKGSSTFKREGQALQRYLDVRNLVLLLRKHGARPGGRGTLRSLLTLICYAWHRYCHEREAGQHNSAVAVWQGLYDGFTGYFGSPRRGPRLWFDELVALLLRR